jgi:RES domain-containing protein
MNDQRQVEGCPHRELVVGWVLHSLEPAEESLVAAHLPDCPVCRSVAAETEEIGAMLGLSVPELVPNAGLEQRILSVTGPRWTAPVASLESSAPPVRGTPLLARHRFGELAAAAAVILVAGAVALGVRVVQLNDQLNEAQRQVKVSSEAIRSAADPAAVRVPLIATDGQPVGMVLASRSQVVVVPTRLPSNQVADQTYVLWGLAGNTPIALAAFDVSGDAPALHVIPSATQMGTFTGYAISLEPGRRAPKVPTDIVATGKVSS